MSFTFRQWIEGISIFGKENELKEELCENKFFDNYNSFGIRLVKNIFSNSSDSYNLVRTLNNGKMITLALLDNDFFVKINNIKITSWYYSNGDYPRINNCTVIKNLPDSNSFIIPEYPCDNIDNCIFNEDKLKQEINYCNIKSNYDNTRTKYSILSNKNNNESCNSIMNFCYGQGNKICKRVFQNLDINFDNEYDILSKSEKVKNLEDKVIIYDQKIQEYEKKLIEYEMKIKDLENKNADELENIQNKNKLLELENSNLNLELIELSKIKDTLSSLINSVMN